MKYRIEQKEYRDGYERNCWEDANQYYYYADSEKEALAQFMTANEENFRWIDGLTVEDHSAWIETHYPAADDHGRTYEVEVDYRAFEDPEDEI